MKQTKLLCLNCGKDITRTMKFYIHNKPYCYDCAEKLKEAIKRSKPVSAESNIKSMYYSGLKPSEIANMTGYTVKEIYEMLIIDEDGDIDED